MVHFYFAGVLKLIMTATFVVDMGVLRAGDPALYQDITAAVASGDLLGSCRTRTGSSPNTRRGESRC